MTDDQVLALLAAIRQGHSIYFSSEAVDLLIWAKTEGMADVDRAVREWHDAKRAKSHGPNGAPKRDGLPRPCDDSAVLGGCCLACQPDGEHCDKHCFQGHMGTYEENHIGVPDGLPRTGRSD